MTVFKRGFTLVELLVVIGLLGILSAVGLASYTASMRNSRDARRKTDLETIRQALEMYKSDNGSYPAGAGNTETTIKATLSSYISAVNFPKDPQSSSNRIYYYNRATATTFYLCAYSEKNGSTVNECRNPAGVAVNVNCKSSVPAQNCNYGVIQP